LPPYERSFLPKRSHWSQEQPSLNSFVSEVNLKFRKNRYIFFRLSGKEEMPHEPIEL
jgi:hypothetical protein